MNKNELILESDPMGQPLRVKIERAIKLLKDNEPEEGYYLAFSGGKDSIVIKQLAIEAGVKFDSWYNLTTLDPPELVQFIKKEHPDVQWSRPDMPMLKYMVEKGKGLPTRLGRWCCQIYKEGCGSDRNKIIGVRAAESSARASRWDEIVPSTALNDYYCPIVHWTDNDVWEFIRDRKLPYPLLYDEGFNRLGCIGCPLGGYNQIKEFKRWPKMERAWKRASTRFFDKWSKIPSTRGINKGKKRVFARNFKTADDYWQWWIKGKKSDYSETCQMELLFTNAQQDDK